MNDWPPAPKGTFYYICDELDKEYGFCGSSDYQMEMIDNKPRYRWYKLALNCVFELELHDKHYDIVGLDLEDFLLYYNAVNWVAQNDSKALEYIMVDLCNVVFPVVKSELIRNLQALGFYKACDIVKKNLKTKAPNHARAYERKRKLVLTSLMAYASDVRQSSNVLDNIRTAYPEKLYAKNPELLEAVSVLFNINKPGSIYNLDDHLKNMLWLFKADKELLAHLFNDAVLIETKDLFIKSLIEHELYELVTFFQSCIPVVKSEYPYFNIPPYTGSVNDLFESDHDWEDEE